MKRGRSNSVKDVLAAVTGASAANDSASRSGIVHMGAPGPVQPSHSTSGNDRPVHRHRPRGHSRQLSANKCLVPSCQRDRLSSEEAMEAAVSAQAPSQANIGLYCRKHQEMALKVETKTQQLAAGGGESTQGVFALAEVSLSMGIGTPKGSPAASPPMGSPQGSPLAYSLQPLDGSSPMSDVLGDGGSSHGKARLRLKVGVGEVERRLPARQNSSGSAELERRLPSRQDSSGSAELVSPRAAEMHSLLMAIRDKSNASRDSNGHGWGRAGAELAESREPQQQYGRGHRRKSLASLGRTRAAAAAAASSSADGDAGWPSGDNYSGPAWMQRSTERQGDFHQSLGRLRISDEEDLTRPQSSPIMASLVESDMGMPPPPAALPSYASSLVRPVKISHDSSGSRPRSSRRNSIFGFNMDVGDESMDNSTVDAITPALTVAAAAYPALDLSLSNGTPQDGFALTSLSTQGSIAPSRDVHALSVPSAASAALSAHLLQPQPQQQHEHLQQQQSLAQGRVIGSVPELNSYNAMNLSGGVATAQPASVVKVTLDEHGHLTGPHSAHVQSTQQHVASVPVGIRRNHMRSRLTSALRSNNADKRLEAMRKSFMNEATQEALQQDTQDSRSDKDASLRASLSLPPPGAGAATALAKVTSVLQRHPDSPTVLFTHPSCLLHDTCSTNLESASRLRAVLKALAGKRFAHLPWVSPETVVPPEDLYSVHDRRYVQSLLQLFDVVEAGFFPHLTLDPPYHDTTISKGSRHAVLYAAGAAVAAVDAVCTGAAKNAFCAVRPPGHHAERASAMAYCILNNIALGAYHAKRVHGLRRIAIVDFGARHGNATQHQLQQDASFLCLSIHRQGIFPYSGSADEHGAHQNVVNVPVADRAGFMRAFPRLIESLDAFQPELVMIAAGFDGHALDLKEHSLQLTDADYDWITERILSVASSPCCGGRVVSVLEAGYNTTHLPVLTAAHVAALMNAPLSNV